MKDGNGFIRRPPDDAIDPAVSAIIRAGQQRQDARSKTPSERKRAARQARIDAERTRQTIDIPLDLKEHLAKIADQLSVPVSQLINRCIWEGLEHLHIETLRNELVPSRSMRFLNILPYPTKGKTK